MTHVCGTTFETTMVSDFVVLASWSDVRGLIDSAIVKNQYIFASSYFPTFLPTKMSSLYVQQESRVQRELPLSSSHLLSSSSSSESLSHLSFVSIPNRPAVGTVLPSSSMFQDPVRTCAYGFVGYSTNSEADDHARPTFSRAVLCTLAAVGIYLPIGACSKKSPHPNPATVGVGPRPWRFSGKGGHAGPRETVFVSFSNRK